MVGIDSSAASQAALRWAYDEAAETGAELVAVHIIDWTRRARGHQARQAARHDVSGRTQERVLASLPSLRAAHPGVALTISISRGRVAPSLVALARDVTLLVVGEPESTEMATLPERLKARCRCDVAAVSAQHHVRWLRDG